MKAASKLRICIVIPAYNEASTIESVIRGMKKELKESPYINEIVVIDDGCSDETASIARKNGALVISHILNTGSGGATATGLSYAKQNDFDIAATMDADGQHAPHDVIRGVDEIIKRNHDLLIGSRLINSDGMSRVKVLGNKGLSFVTYLLFRVNSTDSQSGLRIYSRRALEQLQWETQGYEFCSEMLWRAKQIGLNISEYSIKAIYTEYSKRKGQNNWNAVNIVKSLLKHRITEIFG
jgi:glycosyltransferase involved in cell wall biosynthesis